MGYNDRILARLLVRTKSVRKTDAIRLRHFGSRRERPIYQA